MGLKLRHGDVVFVDTAPFIYFFENNPAYREHLALFFDRVYEYGAQMITSMVTYIEINTVPVRAGNTRLAGKYRDFFTNSEGLSLYPVDLLIAEEAIRLRARHSLKTPDAIQIATAVSCGADYILTNDTTMKKFTDIPVVLVTEVT